MLKRYMIALMSSLLKSLGIFIVLLALVLNIIHFIVRLLPAKNQLIAAVATELLHQPVALEKVRVAGTASHPLITFNNLTLKNPENPKQTELGIKTLVLGINLWRSVLERRWVTDNILVDHLYLSNYPGTLAHKSYAGFLSWLLLQPKMIFKDVDIDWFASRSTELPIRGLELFVSNDGSHHVIAGHLLVKNHITTHLQFILKSVAESYADPKARGVLYLSGQSFILPEWLHFLPKKFLPSHLQVSAGQGDFKLWAHFGNRRLRSIQWLAHLSKLGWRVHKKQWSVTPLTLHGIHFFDEKGLGAIYFSSKNMQLNMPCVFSHLLKKGNLSGRLNWSGHGRGLAFALSGLKFQAAGLHIMTDSTVHLLAKGLPFIDMRGTFSLKHLNQIKGYLPDQVLAPGLMGWLKSALVKGSLSDGQFTFKGPLALFPFDHGGGVFKASVSLHHVLLNYMRRWPMLSRLNGRLLFHNSSVHVFADNAQVAGNKIQHVYADIPNLAKPMLHVGLKSKTNLSAGLNFLVHTPLSIAKDIRLLSGKGPVAAAVHLNIPLFKGSKKTVFTGKVNFLSDKLYFPKWSFGLTNLSGSMHFLNDTLFAKVLHTKLFGQPFLLSLQTEKAKNRLPSLTINANGLVNMSSLLTEFKLPIADTVSGDASVQASLKLYSRFSAANNTIKIASDLKGLAIKNITAPFAKQSAQRWPMRMSAAILKNGELKTSLQVSHLLSGAFLLSHQASGFHVVSGRLLLHGGHAKLPPKAGIYVDGYLKSIDFAAWKIWLADVFAGESGQLSYQLPDALKAINLTIGSVHIFGQHWRDLLFNVTHVAKGILLQMQNDQVSGRIVLPENKNNPVRADFDYLFLKENPTAQVSVMNPLMFPALDIKVADCRVDQQFLSHVQLLTKKLPKGMLIKRFLVASRLYKLDAHGRWIIAGGLQNSHVVGDFTSPNLGEFLLLHHFSSRLKKGKLVSDFSLSWPGSPGQFALKAAQGNFSFSLESGRILQFNTETESNLEFSRLLTLLSLESLSHYLSLDFSLLTRKGFPFKSVTGDFAVDHGDLFTRNIKLDGPLAKVHVSGVIGLSNKKNDLKLTILPYVSSSLPMIVGLAGGPIAGIAAWLVNKVLTPGMGHLMQMHYQLTGSWNKPVIKKPPV